MSDADLQTKIAAIEKLTDLFRFERYVHLTATAIAVAILLVTAVFMIVQKEVGAPALTLIFGSTGVMGYTANRLLVMWTKAMEVVLTPPRKPGNGSQ